MKRILPAVVVVFLLGACSALSPLLTSPNPNQNVDVAGTSAAILKIAVAQTLTAQPTTTFVPPSATMEAGLFATPVSPATDTPASSPTPAGTEMVLTATFDVATSTNVAATIPSGSATATPTLGVLTYGTLPPAVPFSRITLINKSRRQAYISLQVVTAEGGPTIMEYPVRRQVELKAPIGSYLYVAWVGGRKMVGEFRLHKDEDLEILIYSDKIVIR